MVSDTLVSHAAIVCHHGVNRGFKIVVFQSEFVVAVIFQRFMSEVLYFAQIDLVSLLMCISNILTSQISLFKYV